MKQKEAVERYIQADATNSVEELLRLRLPWLLVGLVGGAAASFLVSRYERILEEHLALAFFLPLMVYMSDAVGTQTETIYIRNLARRQIGFLRYLAKELAVGVSLGALFGLLLGIIAFLWIGQAALAFTVGLSMFTTVACAPVVALCIASLLYEEHTDPALGAGPFTTILQDILSLLIYLTIASLVLFR